MESQGEDANTKDGGTFKLASIFHPLISSNRSVESSDGELAFGTF